MNIKILKRRPEFLKLTKSFLRDNPLCHICSLKAQNVHHIIPLDYSLEGESALKQLKSLHFPKNFLSVCIPCHKKIHSNIGCFKKGTKNPSAILNESQVKEIRLRHKKGESLISIAKDYPAVKVKTVKQIIYRFHWKHI